MIDFPGLHARGHRNELFILLHAFCQSPKRMDSIRRAIEDAISDADVFVPEMPYGGMLGWLCTKDSSDVVCDLIDQIDRIVEERGKRGDGGYTAIHFVGHSMGGVFARKVAIVAHGEQRFAGDAVDLEAPFEKAFQRYKDKPRSWVGKIRRIVLIAGMNRGWSTSSAMDWLTATWWSIGVFVGETLFNGRPIIFDIRQGAVFSVQTRLQWLALMHRQRQGERPDIVVTQLLGTVDDMVSPDDSVDYAVDSEFTEARRSYFYIEVPRSTHADIVEVGKPSDVDVLAPRDTWIEPSPTLVAKFSPANLRYVEIMRGLRAPREILARSAVAREQMSDSLPAKPNWNVKDVVFVIHGIRDKGFWTQKIARAIKQEAATRKEEFRSVTTSYGYFAMAPFVLPWVRKHKAEWLMDQYAETRAHYPLARFSYVGHSNGTYLLARALKDYPSARFHRIVFAGSVVRRDYKWLDLVSENRVKEVLNYVATSDWVVAIFPKGMQLIPMLDLGSAGHDGFNQASANGPVRQITYIKGSHGAGHEEEHWGDIAKFIVHGSHPRRNAVRQSLLVKAAGYVSTLLLAAILVGVVWIGWRIAAPALCNLPLISDALRCGPYLAERLSAATVAARAFAAVLYAWFVYIVVSRV